MCYNKGMSTSVPTQEEIEYACDMVADECMNRYCSVASYYAPTTYTETINGVTVEAEVEGDPDGNYVSFTATVDGVEVGTGSVVDGVFRFTQAVAA